MNWFRGQHSLGAFVTSLGTLITGASLASAQPLQPEVLVSFGGGNGWAPEAALTQGNDGNFYGTTEVGGGSLGFGYGPGTVFQMTTNGVLSWVAGISGTNADSRPRGALAQGNDGNFYGTTFLGGNTSGFGTVFRVTPNGLATTLISFDGTNGSRPWAGLVLGGDGNFYGTTYSGGGHGKGTVFRVATNGVLAMLYSFGTITNTNGIALDGAAPLAALLLASDGSFYGTTSSGGAYTNQYGPDGLGTVFRLTTNGQLTTLVSFDGTNGEYPAGGLIECGEGIFYGTTYSGGLGVGTIFRMTTNGTLTTLVALSSYFGNPYADLTLGSDGNFYGTTSMGGDVSLGTAFQVTTNGELTTLVSFNGYDGAIPNAGLTLGTDGNFYGTTAGLDNIDYGNSGFYGTVYRLRRGVSMQSFGMASNGFQINTLNVGGSGRVVLESSSDLMTWTPIQTNGTAAAQQFLDPTALIQPQQFYRVRQQ